MIDKRAEGLPGAIFYHSSRHVVAFDIFGTRLDPAPDEKIDYSNSTIEGWVFFMRSEPK